MFPSLFLLHMQAQKKKLSKRKRRKRAFALCGARQELRALDSASLPKGLTETLKEVAKALIWCVKILIWQARFFSEKN